MNRHLVISEVKSSRLIGLSWLLWPSGGRSHHLPANQQSPAAALLGREVRPVQQSAGSAHGSREAEPEAPQPQHHQRTRARQCARSARRHALPGQRHGPERPTQVSAESIGTPHWLKRGVFYYCLDWDQ